MAEEQTTTAVRSENFTDRLGRTWDVTITWPIMERIDETNFHEHFDEPFSIFKPPAEFFRKLSEDKKLAIILMWHIVEPVAEAEGIDLDSFFSGFDGVALANGVEALWETLGNFFPEAKIALSKLRNLQKRAEEMATEAMDRMEGQAMKVMEKEIGDAVSDIETTFANHVGTSDESSDNSNSHQAN